MNNTTIQYRLSNGSWVDCNERTDEFVARVVAKHGIDAAAAIDAMAAGKIFYHGTDWYDQLRAKPAARPAPALPVSNVDVEQDGGGYAPGE